MKEHPEKGKYEKLIIQDKQMYRRMICKKTV